MSETVAHCPCGEVHEPYEGYRYCPHFSTKIRIIAKRKNMEPVEVISKSLWDEPVEKELMGYAHE